MKLVVRAVTALALLAFATPALPCGDKEKTTTASSASASETVAKAGTAGKGEKQKKVVAKGEAKPATATN
jgi:hypothetical protein